MPERADGDLDRARAADRDRGGDELGADGVTITNGIIAICVVAYIWQVTTGGPNADHGELYGPAVVQLGQWWRIFTAAFLHGSIPHIALNMIALYQVGNIVERVMGPVRYVLLYAMATAGSGLAVLWFNFNVPTLGASGAIFGLFGALVAIGLSLPPRGMSLVTQTLPIIGINLAFGFAVPGISNAGHIGGLVSGFVAGWLLFQIPSPYRDRANLLINGPALGVAAGEPAAVPFDPTVDGRVETIEQPPQAGPHEGPGAPPHEVRDPRE
jgi:membrane associated rhomboid family serine protease